MGGLVAFTMTSQELLYGLSLIDFSSDATEKGAENFCS